MPVGYLVSMVIAGAATLLALRPRPTRGPHTTFAFIIESNANELPFIIFYAVLASTILAVNEPGAFSPVGWVGFGFAVLTTIGLVIVVRQATDARAVLDDALRSGIGVARPGLPHLPLGRVLVAPLRLTARDVKRTRDVAYGPHGKHNTLDIYRSRTQPTSSVVLVYLHPGGFFSGVKSRESRLLADCAVSKGWMYVSANYRLGAAGAFPNNVVDAKRVIAWVRDHSQELSVDSGPIVLVGGSAGAHLAAMCALTPNDPTFQPDFESADTSVAAAIGLYGFYGAAPTNGMPSAPADYVNANAAPFFAIHGNRDPMVAPAAAREFVALLSSKSMNPVVYAELPGAQHNFDRFASIRCAAVVDAIEAFVASVV